MQIRTILLFAVTVATASAAAVAAADNAGAGVVTRAEADVIEAVRPKSYAKHYQ